MTRSRSRAARSSPRSPWTSRPAQGGCGACSASSRRAASVLTHDAKFDVPLLETALRMPVAFVGAMGSRRTHEDRDRRPREAGLSEREPARLRSPIGLDLGARTPEETALSNAAEIVAARQGGTGVPLTGTRTPIHRPGTERDAPERDGTRRNGTASRPPEPVPPPWTARRTGTADGGGEGADGAGWTAKGWTAKGPSAGTGRTPDCRARSSMSGPEAVAPTGDAPGALLQRPRPLTASGGETSPVPRRGPRRPCRPCGRRRRATAAPPDR